jgi:hypothetical protein
MLDNQTLLSLIHIRTIGVGIIGAMAVGTTGDGIVGDQRLFGILITPMGTAAINTQRQFAVEIM